MAEDYQLVSKFPRNRAGLFSQLAVLQKIDRSTIESQVLECITTGLIEYLVSENQVTMPQKLLVLRLVRLEQIPARRRG